jgi:hypothetical protein
MADANEEEVFIFRGQNLGCQKELLAQGSLVYAGYFKEDDIVYDRGFGGRSITVKREAAIRRMRQTDCLDDWNVMAKKFMQLNTKYRMKTDFDLKIVSQIFAYEDDNDGWR